MQIETRLISELIPYIHNSRAHDETQVDRIANSISQFGFTQPIVIDGSNVVVAGHGRLAAARKLGMDEVPVVRLSDLTDTQIRAYRILDNKLQNDSTWDVESLSTELDALHLEEFDFGAWGLDELVDDLGLNDEEENKQRDAEDELPATSSAAARVKVGDLIELGEHKLLCGDSLDPQQAARLLGSKKCVDLVFTDPPYAIYGSSTGIAADIADDKMIRPFFKGVVEAVMRHCQPFAHIYICCDWRSWASWWEVSKGTGLCAKNMLVWDKSGGLGGMYANCHELMLFASARPMRKNMSEDISGERNCYGSNIWKINRASSEEAGDTREHNAQKPLELVERAIENSTDAGALVLDLFLGSGTTMLAAERKGRICYGMEIEPKYCEVIIERYRRHCTKSGKEFHVKLNGEEIAW